MILGVHPEDRDRGHALFLLGAPRELNRGDRLQQREQRSAEHARLLPGDDGDRRGVGEARAGRARRGRRVARILLRGDHGGDRSPIARMLLRARDGVAPRAGRQRVARVERRDLLKVEGVVAGERTDPGKATDVDGDGALAAALIRRRRTDRLGWHGLVLSQSHRKPVKAMRRARA